MGPYREWDMTDRRPSFTGTAPGPSLTGVR